jgi:hypothetical protein
MGRRAIEAAEAAEREHRSRGDQLRGDLAQIARKVMSHKVDLVERGEISASTWSAAPGIGRFLGEYHWGAIDEPFVGAMEECELLWGPALEELRPEWAPWEGRGHAGWVPSQSG